MSDNSIIVADIGNTSISIGVFQKFAKGLSSPLETGTIQNDSFDFESVNSLFANQTGPIYVASVCRPARDRFADLIASKTAAEVHEITHLDLPLTVELPDPQNVGIDRLVGAVAADRLRSKNRPAIVVDAGTAITIDVVSREGSFVGGVIMAGFRMRTRALSQQTDLLPFVDPEVRHTEPKLIGKNTSAAIQSGIYWGTVGSIREVVSKLRSQLGHPHIFITGGDMQLISKHIADADFVPHLVISGIAITAQERFSEH